MRKGLKVRFFASPEVRGAVKINGNSYHDLSIGFLWFWVGSAVELRQAIVKMVR